MNVELATHPTSESLLAFFAGTLDDSSRATVAQHLEGCAACRGKEAGAAAVKLEGTPPPVKSLDEVTWSAKGKRVKAAGDVPHELAKHPHYEILQELGRGGMGVVYLARNRLMDRLEVVKVVHRAFIESPEAMERFLREIQSAGKLRHDNVVGAYSALHGDNLLGFAMEYIDGKDLAQVVAAQGPLSVVHACHYIRQAALGLQHAHEKGMIHRDIKPQNLILAREGKKHTVKILDFGLAKATRDKKIDTGLTGVGALLGTPDYMAPEQILDAASADIRSDIYSLGCTFYFLLAGRPPFRAKSVFDLLQAHQVVEATRLDLVRPDVSPQLAAVVATMMAKDPGQRYQTPNAVARALVPFLKAAKAATPDSATPPKTSEVDTDEFAIAAETVVAEENTRRETKVKPLPNAQRRTWIAASVGCIGLLAAFAIGIAAYGPTGSAPGCINVDDSNGEPAQQLVAAVLPRETLPAGLLVLDNCDEQSSGKNEYNDQLTLWDGQGAETFRVGGFNNSETVGCNHRVAVDARRKSIWVIEDANRRIRRFDFRGTPTLTIDDVRGTAIAVDSETGHVWATGTEGPNGNGKTVVYNTMGEAIAAHPVSGLDIVYDAQTKSIWIAHRSLTKIVAATGEQVSVGVSALCVSSLAADPKNGGVWLTTRGLDIQPDGNRLLRFDAQAKEQTRINLGPKIPFAVSVDATDGSVWVAMLRESIERFTADGAPQQSHAVHAFSVLAAPDGAVWAVTPGDVQKISLQGDVTLRLRHARTSNQAWIASIDGR